MEPLSAFAVACNVLQVVEVGVKAISLAVEYRQSDNSFLAEHGELRNITDSLSGLNETLNVSLKRHGYGTISPEEARLKEANRDCLRLSEDFVIALDRLKISKDKSVLDSIRLSVKVLWSKNKIAAMEKSLSQARSNLNTSLLVYISSKQAAQVTRYDLEEQSALTEKRIVERIVSSSGKMQNDLTTLGEQISSLDLGSSQKILDDFSITHTSQMDALIERICAAMASREAQVMKSGKPEASIDYQAFKKSLDFPQIEHRRDQIPPAYKETYKWILRSSSQSSQLWHNFVAWLGDSNCQHHIYWVNGKIGAGKTVLMRYLDESLDPQVHMRPWAEGHDVFSVNYFFWGPGNKLQKCITGLLRTLLLQLVEQLPQEAVCSAVPAKWRVTSSADKADSEWTNPELLACLTKCVDSIGFGQKLFILIDGLDEIEDHESAQEALLELLLDLATRSHVKIAVSSRPWNLFKDALGQCPSLRLEDLTQNDITLFVRQQLLTSKRYQFLLEHDVVSAGSLVQTVVKRSAGVFLWVRLVVTKLLRSLRNGEGMLSLQRRINELPADLDDYFAGLIQSIQPHDRSAASRLFQAALHTEDGWITLLSNCLLDVSFLEHEKASFALEAFYNHSQLDLSDKSAMFFRLDSALRSVNSLGMGLIECHVGTHPPNVQNFSLYPEKHFLLAVQSSNKEAFFRKKVEALEDHPSITPRAATDIIESDPLTSASWTIEFLHRSLRDFLRTPKMQTLLHEYSQGPFDARSFYVNARIVQLEALAKVNAYTSTKLGLASNILCKLGMPEHSYSNETRIVGQIVKPFVETLATLDQKQSNPGWYISCVLRSWKSEKGSFLTTAIDFAMNSYVLANLTPHEVANKEGRPLLDHILRPRFAGCAPQMRTANQVPDVILLRAVLQLGAKPNEIFDFASVWALFLCAISDALSGIDLIDDLQYETACLSAMEVLLQNGADLVLPQHWLSQRHYYHCYVDHSRSDLEVISSVVRFEDRFPDANCFRQSSREGPAVYLVSDLLASMQVLFSQSLEDVRRLALQKEAQLNNQPCNSVS